MSTISTAVRASRRRRLTEAQAIALDSTPARIRAFLAAVVPLRGSDAAEDERYQRGRSLIERLALSAEGGDTYDPPTLNLTTTECADVLYFVSRSEALDGPTWWDDPKDAASHLCGFMFIMDAVEESLRGKVRS